MSELLFLAWLISSAIFFAFLVVRIVRRTEIEEAVRFGQIFLPQLLILYLIWFLAPFSLSLRASLVLAVFMIVCALVIVFNRPSHSENRSVRREVRLTAWFCGFYIFLGLGIFFHVVSPLMIGLAIGAGFLCRPFFLALASAYHHFPRPIWGEFLDLFIIPFYGFFAVFFTITVVSFWPIIGYILGFPEVAGVYLFLGVFFLLAVVTCNRFLPWRLIGRSLLVLNVLLILWFNLSNYLQRRLSEADRRPRIYELNPDFGFAGSIITVKGVNFGEPGESIVTIGGTVPLVEQWTRRELVLKTTVLTVTGPVVVTRFISEKEGETALGSNQLSFVVGNTAPKTSSWEEIFRRLETERLADD